MSEEGKRRLDTDIGKHDKNDDKKSDCNIQVNTYVKHVNVLKDGFTQTKSSLK